VVIAVFVLTVLLMFAVAVFHPIHVESHFLLRITYLLPNFPTLRT
jgi:hypothetical protein